MKVAELSPLEVMPNSLVAPDVLSVQEEITQTQPQAPDTYRQALYDAAPGLNSTPQEIQEFMRPKDPEVQRLINFEQAIKRGDEETASTILQQAGEASKATGSSEQSYLASRWDAERQTRQRRDALDRALELGDSEGLNILLDKAEAASPVEYDDLMNRVGQYRRTAEALPPEEGSRRRDVAFEEAVQQYDGPRQSFLLDKEFNRAKGVGDYGVYDQMLRRMYRDYPEMYEEARERAFAFQRAKKSDDLGAMQAIVDWAETQGINTGFTHEYNRLKEQMPQGYVASHSIARPSASEVERPVRLPARLRNVGRFLMREARVVLGRLK